MVPRQIANAATIWATANMILFLPFAGLFARMAHMIVPEREAVREKAIVTPRFLDESVIQVPALALERARMEMGHMAECISEMTEKIRPAFEARDAGELALMHDRVVVLRTAILDYLQRTGRHTLTEEESAEHARLVYATAAIESLSSAISRELGPLANAIGDAGFTLSETTGELLRQLYADVSDLSRKALSAIVERDERLAQEVVSERERLRKLGTQLINQQVERLSLDDPDRLEKHRYAVDMLDKLRRVHNTAEHMAIMVLPSPVVVGELAGA